MESQVLLSELPTELLTHIYSYLPRRERFIFMRVGSKWKAAMDDPRLWRHMRVWLNVDFFDVSTIQLCLEYCWHLRSLEITFDLSENRMGLLTDKLISITKRTYRFIWIFMNRNIQLEQISFKNFGDLYNSKKIYYYFSLFLRSQYKLKKIMFNGSYFSKKGLLKLLSSSISESKSYIEYLDIQRSYYDNENQVFPGRISLVSIQLMICIVTISNLTTLKIDLATLVKIDVLRGFVDGNCKDLKYIHIDVSDSSVVYTNHMEFYSDIRWIKIVQRFPRLKTSLSFYEIFFSEETMEMIILHTMPLYHVYWFGELITLRNINFQILSVFQNILEIISFETTYESLDDTLGKAAEKCPKIKYLEFTGFINDVVRVHETLKRNGFKGATNLENSKENGKNQKVYFNKERACKICKTE